MPTNTAGSKARELPWQAIHYLRKTVKYTDDGVAVDVGVLPAGAVMLGPISGAAVATAFDAGTTNTLNIGTTADPNLYMTVGAIGALAFTPLDEAVSHRVAVDTTITATVVLTGTASTEGEAEVIIAYIPDNDG